MKLVWTKQLSVGNAFIDSDHRHLIGMVNSVIHVIGTRDCGILAQGFDLLESWLCTHFKNEEHIAQAVNFNFLKHKSAQQHSLNELQHLRGELMAKNGMWPDSAVGNFAHSLESWMIDRHIINLDMLMKSALQTHDYEFWPGRAGGDVNHVAGHVAGLYLQIPNVQ